MPILVTALVPSRIAEIVWVPVPVEVPVRVPLLSGLRSSAPPPESRRVPVPVTLFIRLNFRVLLTVSSVVVVEAAVLMTLLSATVVLSAAVLRIVPPPRLTIVVRLRPMMPKADVSSRTPLVRLYWSMPVALLVPTAVSARLSSTTQLVVTVPPDWLKVPWPSMPP